MIGCVVCLLFGMLFGAYAILFAIAWIDDEEEAGIYAREDKKEKSW